jgi:hypothetical protein
MANKLIKNKIFFVALLIFSLVFLTTGCLSKKEASNIEPDGDSGFLYENKDLGFSINLPPEFKYYQVQRKNNSDFIDIEFFIPTSDTAYSQEVEGYGKPLVVRIYNRPYWEGLKEDGEDKAVYVKVKENDKKVYGLKFWKDLPADWQGKWNIGVEKAVIDSFKLI